MVRLKNPRGFFRPESSASSACSVPPPPPPPIIITRDLVCGLGARSGAERHSSPCAPLGRHGEEDPMYGAASRNCETLLEAKPPSVLPPRLPSESASSKNTTTPPYRSASLRSL